MVEDKKYGIINNPNFSFQGYTLEELKEVADYCENNQVDFYDYSGDLAIFPALLHSLIATIENQQCEIESLLSVRKDEATQKGGNSRLYNLSAMMDKTLNPDKSVTKSLEYLGDLSLQELFNERA